MALAVALIQEEEEEEEFLLMMEAARIAANDWMEMEEGVGLGIVLYLFSYILYHIIVKLRWKLVIYILYF